MAVLTASRRGARVAHFPEGSLSGCQLGLWVVLGSAHRLSDSHKPHNSLYIISDAGRIVERYDKRFCSGDPGGRSGDLAHYSPGGHFSVWDRDFSGILSPLSFRSRRSP